MASRTIPRRGQKTPEDVGTLWTMQRFEANARCALMALSRTWELRVLIDGNILLAEPCDRSDDAFSLAERWKQRLLKDGWRQIVPRESGGSAA